MENKSKELKKPYEFLSKNERLLLGFLQDCPKQYTEIINYMDSLKVKQRTAINILNRLAKDREIFRIKKAENNRVFYRLNDFPHNIDALLFLLEAYNTENPWEKLFKEKLDYNFKTLYPKYEPKQIWNITLIDFRVNYNKYSYGILLEAIKRVDISKIIESLKEISHLKGSG